MNSCNTAEVKMSICNFSVFVNFASSVVTTFCFSNETKRSYTLKKSGTVCLGGCKPGVCQLRLDNEFTLGTDVRLCKYIQVYLYPKHYGAHCMYRCILSTMHSLLLHWSICIYFTRSGLHKGDLVAHPFHIILVSFD